MPGTHISGARRIICVVGDGWRRACPNIVSSAGLTRAAFAICGENGVVERNGLSCIMEHICRHDDRPTDVCRYPINLNDQVGADNSKA